ncbi:hypothetical protein OWM54_18645 [Myxococcus sp. MISCRS1]|uniref:hypothetical protein n=1 Tax=Myxococcus sp. MISCRS1 TaxID=2996786 RepID=UPI0022703E66|nr:hypothetical protein [Myxococcus sp. MISCRS1]MCY0999165.1 hypothetical protein [Myxococcus sp. MISCRS1]
MTKPFVFWSLWVVCLGCAGSPEVEPRGSSAWSTRDGLAEEYTYVELTSDADLETRAGSFLPMGWARQALGDDVDPLKGAIATRPVRRTPGAGPLRRPPLLTPRPAPLQAQVQARRTVDAAVVLQARKLYQQRLQEAQTTYPNSAGYENHHLVPLYLGGAKDGQTYRLPTAYHKAITRAFREEWRYGQGQRPDARALTDILVRVYSRYPIPQLIGIPP